MNSSLINKGKKVLLCCLTGENKDHIMNVYIHNIVSVTNLIYFNTNLPFTIDLDYIHDIIRNNNILKNDGNKICHKNGYDKYILFTEHGKFIIFPSGTVIETGFINEMDIINDLDIFINEMKKIELFNNIHIGDRNIKSIVSSAETNFELCTLAFAIDKNISNDLIKDDCQCGSRFCSPNIWYIPEKSEESFFCNHKGVIIYTGKNEISNLSGIYKNVFNVLEDYNNTIALNKRREVLLVFKYKSCIMIEKQSKRDI